MYKRFLKYIKDNKRWVYLSVIFTVVVLASFFTYYYLKLDRSIIIKYMIDEHIKEIGQEFTVEYTIKNTNKENIKIDSLELKLPDNIELVEVSPAGYINQYPGISDGTYMWVNDSYIIEGEDEINLIVKLKGTGPGKSLIKFRVTSHESYIDCDDIKMEIKG